jgi:hypothetical protein
MIVTSGKSCVLERPADHADAAVHHVRGAEDVAAGLGLRQRLPLQRQQGLVVEDAPSRTRPSWPSEL